MSANEIGRRMARGSFRANSSPAVIDTLQHGWSKMDPSTARQEYPWADRFVLGLPLAPWQRPFKWSPDQCAAFISSVWMGAHLGTYIITEMDLKKGGVVEFLPLSNMVIDGQQRLKALELYFSDKIALPDAEGRPTLWSEVHLADQRRFSCTTFTRSTIPLESEADLRGYYDVLNFGGTQHEESERASPTDTASVDIEAEGQGNTP